MSRWYVVLIAALFHLSACTEPEETFRLEPISLGQPGRPLIADGTPERVSGIAADAKQRFVWGPTVPVRQLEGLDQWGGETYKVASRQLVCAEPSPDALSTFSASVAAALRAEVAGQGGAGGEFSQSLSETARILGQRTPTIQLLRDVFYRACEAYSNALVDSFGYALILNKMDELMVELVAIDALGQGQLTEADVAKVQQSAEAEEAAEVARVALHEAQQASAAARTRVENLRAQQRGLAGQLSSLKAEQAQAQATVTAATAADQKLPAARTASIDLANQIATKEAEAAQAPSPTLAGELAALRAQKQVADANLRDLEATIARGAPARGREAEITAGLGPLEAQKAAIDADTSTAATAETTARTTETSARSEFAKQQALAEGRRAVVGTIRPELSSAAMMQIGQIVKGSRETDPSNTVVGACALWFAQHPGYRTRFSANGKLVLVGEVPVIAAFCAGALNAALTKLAARTQ